MGILNVTPDSFSDGGRFDHPDAALLRARQMVEAGADMIDIGGESTRPGAAPVPAAEEIRRICPLISRLSSIGDVIISVDTRKAEVAAAAVAHGAQIINDVSGLSDPDMASTVARSGAGLVIMHMQGDPATMQDDPVYTDVVGEVAGFLSARVQQAIDAGIGSECIVIDPGIGFGKTLEHNIALLRSIPVLVSRCRRPLLAGVSRKRMIGTITGREVDDRLAGSLAAAAYALMQGARIIRVHDVKESCDVARVIDRLDASSGA